jgi:hypothetical protein
MFVAKDAGLVINCGQSLYSLWLPRRMSSRKRQRCGINGSVVIFATTS